MKFCTLLEVKILVLCMTSYFCAVQSSDQTLLTKIPLIMSHDSASGEIVESRDHIIRTWADTQGVGLVDQLNCGARAFDYRPYFNDGVLFAHHGGVIIRKPMAESITEIKKWNSENSEDLVIMYISHFYGDDGCDDAVANLLNSMNVYSVRDCSVLKGLTMGEAKQKSKLISGGYLMAVFDCMDEYFDSTINCYGSNFVCYNSWPENTSEIPWKSLKDYMSLVTSSYPDNENTLWMSQAHWQSSALTVSLGTLHNSSLLLDESRSGVNKWLVTQIKEKAFKSLNMIEVDNICDGGMEIYKALKEYTECIE